MPLPKERIYTIDDIYALPDGKRAELVKGQIFFMAPPSPLHQEILSFLHAKIYNYIEQKKCICKVYPAPFAVFLDKKSNTYVEPDISVICDKDKLDEMPVIYRFSDKVKANIYDDLEIDFSKMNIDESIKRP